MRLSLDVTAVPAAPAGAGRYTLELAGALSERDDVDVQLLTRRGDEARWRCWGAGLVPAAPSARPLRLCWEQVVLPGLLGRLGVDVHHGPHYTMPERARTPVVVTVHDCTFFDHPEWHERAKVLLFRRAIRVASRRAAALVCVSETTARHLRRVAEPAGPVFVAPHGVDHARFSPKASEFDEDALAALGLDPARRFVLFVGTVEPRKGVASLVRAFARVADADPDVTLVIAGRRGWGTEEVDGALAESARHRARIVWPGYVADDAVPALFRHATAVAYPSLAEGYGLPALEALACGAPLVTTEGTAMAELAGDAALLVPPGDVGALADALGVLLGAGPDDPQVASRRELGLVRSAARTWAASADVHMAAYRAAAQA